MHVQMAARETGIGAVEQYMHAGKLLALDLLVQVLDNPTHNWSSVRPEVTFRCPKRSIHLFDGPESPRTSSCVQRTGLLQRKSKGTQSNLEPQVSRFLCFGLQMVGAHWTSSRIAQMQHFEFGMSCPEMTRCGLHSVVWARGMDRSQSIPRCLVLKQLFSSTRVL